MKVWAKAAVTQPLLLRGRRGKTQISQGLQRLRADPEHRSAEEVGSESVGEGLGQAFERAFSTSVVAAGYRLANSDASGVSDGKSPPAALDEATSVQRR